MRETDSNGRVVVRLEKQLFGIPGNLVREMVPLPKVAQLPGLPPYATGVINLRGEVVPVFNLRLRLGYPSRQQQEAEICTMMAQREQDHKNWIAELEASVLEDREFKLTTDPHLCKFGKWYYDYQTDDPFFRAYLNRFESPHNRIHAVAIEVRKLLLDGNKNAAIRLIREARDGILQQMMHLFVQFRDEYARGHSEIGVIMQGGARPYSISVDAAVSMEPVAHVNDEEAFALSRFPSDADVSIGKLKRNGDIVVLLDPSRLFLAA